MGIHGWALTYSSTSRRKHHRRRSLVAGVVWSASFAVVTEDGDVSSLATSTSSLLEDESFHQTSGLPWPSTRAQLTSLKGPALRRRRRRIFRFQLRRLIRRSVPRLCCRRAALWLDPHGSPLSSRLPRRRPPQSLLIDPMPRYHRHWHLQWPQLLTTKMRLKLPARLFF